MALFLFQPSKYERKIPFILYNSQFKKILYLRIRSDKLSKRNKSNFTLLIEEESSMFL